jgi:hypothetical protein
LGWAQFEYLVRQEAGDLIDEKATVKTVESHAWQYLKQNVKNLKVRLRLDLVFHANHAVLAKLAKDYEVRNEAAHDYKYLPKEARDISDWLRGLEDLVAKF